jgi:hypothetical protein
MESGCYCQQKLRFFDFENMPVTPEEWLLLSFTVRNDVPADCCVSIAASKANFVTRGLVTRCRELGLSTPLADVIRSVLTMGSQMLLNQARTSSRH